MSDPTREERPRRDHDESIDKALDQATTPPSPPKPDVSLKRQWDDELEAELEATMSGFDAEEFDVLTKGRTRASDRAHAPKGGIGQEDRPGVQQAKVVAVRGDTVFLDLGAKSEGVVPLAQFEEEEIPKTGDMIEVVFDRFDHDEGLLLMSRKGAAVEANWENLRKGLIVEARGVKEIKGGLQVEVGGIRGFIPISQLEMNRIEDAKEFVNQKFRAIVTEANQRERNLVLSRRELLEQERAEQREKTWAELEEGQVRTGKVRSIKDFGAFVDIGGVDGLIHISDASWGRIKDIGEVVKHGDEVEVKVLRVDREAQRVGLGLKQLQRSPWDDIEDNYERGQTVRGKVTKLMDFGAFVELEPGIEGLIHISELANRRVVRVRDAVQPDQEVEVRILDIDPDAKRISLSLKPLPEGVTAVPEEVEDDDTPPPPKPERKIPLKGGLGDGDTKLF